jgi:hypothetical protein
MHPPLVETRRTFRRKIDEFFLCCRHQHFPPIYRWILSFLDHMEANIWTDTAASDDLWNGRWPTDLIQSLLLSCWTLLGHIFPRRTSPGRSSGFRPLLACYSAPNGLFTPRDERNCHPWRLPNAMRGTPALASMPLPQLPLSTRLATHGNAVLAL